LNLWEAEPEAIMARTGFLRAHRTWEDWVGIALGILILLAPWITDETDHRAAVVNATIFGVAVMVLAELDLVDFRRWTEVAMIGCGLWVLLSPAVLGYGGALATWHLVAGLAAAALGALELWQGVKAQAD
jgi:SPW repeat